MVYVAIQLIDADEQRMVDLAAPVDMVVGKNPLTRRMDFIDLV